MLKEKNLFDSSWNTEGQGVENAYSKIERNGVALVTDQATGLTWQQSGSPNFMNYAAAQAYVDSLNRARFAGFNDWRLPTLEEAMSLMEREKKNGDLHIDPVFDKTQNWFWTADKSSAEPAWVVNFYSGYCNYDVYVGIYGLVRAVRS